MEEVTDKKPEIAMFRLVTGEDVVAEYFVSYFNSITAYSFTNPVKLIHRRYQDGQIGIALTPWLPDEILMPGDVSVVIYQRDILTMAHLRERMQDFYSQFIKEHRDSLTRNSAMLDKHLTTLTTMYARQADNGLPKELETDFDKLDEDDNDTTH